MMKSNRDNFIFYLTQIVPVIVALVISIIIYRYWSDNNKACLALTWAAIIFLFLCFYNIIFKNKRNGMIIPILSGLSILLFANKFYDYDTLKTLLPILKNIDSSLFAIMLLGGLLFLLLFAKFVVYLCSDSENRILMSSPIVHSLMYCLSSFTTSSKSVMLLRPLTCHIPVSPGLVARRAR